MTTRPSNLGRRAIVVQRAAGACEICDVELDPGLPVTDRRAPSLHHRYPRRDGGRDLVSNMLRLCRKCHTELIHGDEELAYLLGRMSHERDTKGTPVLTRHGWVLLAEDGSIESLPEYTLPVLTTPCEQQTA